MARRRTLGPSDMSGCNPLLSCLPQLRRQESFTLVRVVDPSLKSDSVNNTLLCTACECQDDDRPSLKACPDCDEYFCDVECLRRTSCPHLECSVDRVLADAEAICGIGCQCRCCKARWPPLCDDCEAIPCYCQRKSGNERSRWRAKYGGAGPWEASPGNLYPRVSPGLWTSAEAAGLRSLGVPGPTAAQ